MLFHFFIKNLKSQSVFGIPLEMVRKIVGIDDRHPDVYIIEFAEKENRIQEMWIYLEKSHCKINLYKNFSVLTMTDNKEFRPFDIILKFSIVMTDGWFSLYGKAKLECKYINVPTNQSDDLKR